MSSATVRKNGQRMPTPTWLTASTTAREHTMAPQKTIDGGMSEGEVHLKADTTGVRANAMQLPESTTSTSASVYETGGAPKADSSEAPNGASRARATSAAWGRAAAVNHNATSTSRRTSGTNGV